VYKRQDHRHAWAAWCDAPAAWNVRV